MCSLENKKQQTDDVLQAPRSNTTTAGVVTMVGDGNQRPFRNMAAVDGMGWNLPQSHFLSPQLLGCNSHTLGDSINLIPPISYMFTGCGSYIALVSVLNYDSNQSYIC